MTVRAAIFGISRSGKDYTIHDASEILSEKGMLFSHISPITIVHQELKEHKLRNIPEAEKHNLIVAVRKVMSPLLNDEYVFVDEHYAFPQKYGGIKIDNGYYGEKLPSFGRGRFGDITYDIVYDENWIGDYDLAIYMDINPEIIRERFRTSEGDKKNMFITYEDIRSWQLFEIKKIREICKKADIPLYFVYDHKQSGEELDVIIEQFLGHRQQEQKETTP